MTNYRKIKSMSIDEMAEFLGEDLMPCAICPNANNCSMSLDYDCEDVVRKWLKQKVRKIK